MLQVSQIDWEGRTDGPCEKDDSIINLITNLQIHCIYYLMKECCSSIWIILGNLTTKYRL